MLKVFLITQVHLLFLVKDPNGVEMVITFSFAMMKFLPNLWSFSGSLSSTGAVLVPQVDSLNPHTRYAKLLVKLKPGALVQFLIAFVHGPLPSVLVQQVPI